MNKRIQLIIQNLGIKKVEFAKRLKLSPPYISELCSGKTAPSDRTISDICREFSVNEVWLRTGEGEMFVPTRRDDQIAEFIGRVMAGERDDFKRRFVAMLARLSESEWELIEKKALELFEDTKKD